jgi:NADP-dependent 3-hydroxy acid dehydrogenase YdfG
MHFKDKVVWITGLHLVLAKELAIQLSQQGYTYFNLFNESLLKDVAAELNYSKVYILPYDLLNLMVYPILYPVL